MNFLNLCIMFQFSFCLFNCNFNFYINSSETRRLLGLMEDLYYVRNGTLNLNALKLTLPVPVHVHEVYFAWDATPKNPHRLGYSLAFHNLKPPSINMPTCDIPMGGTLPTHKSVFKVAFQCTGFFSTEHITMHINLNTSSYAPIKLRMTKYCNISVHGIDDIGALWQQDLDASDSDESTSGFYVGVGLMFGFIVVISVVLSTCYLHRTKHHNTRKNSMVSILRSLNYNDGGFSRDETSEKPLKDISKKQCQKQHVQGKTSSQSSSTHPSPSSSHPPISHHHHQNPSKTLSVSSLPISCLDLSCADARSNLQDLEIDASSVAFDTLLVQGSYGRMFGGHLVGSCEVVMKKKANESIIIKTLTGDANRESLEEFLRRGCLTRGLYHPHVLCLEAAVIHNTTRPMLVYSAHGDKDMDKDNRTMSAFDTNLKLHMTGTRNGEKKALSSVQLVMIGKQIAEGMHYLHKRHLVHGDLACRNCLINSDLVVKVTDSALSFDLFREDYDRLDCSELRPIRWLSLEALKDKLYSPSSDVWSFGVLLWELMTACEQPYSHVASSLQLVTLLNQGFRLSQPPFCSRSLFSMMACCWAVNAEDRPNFGQLCLSLQSILHNMPQPEV